jgi:hypothetical protein
MSFFNADVKLVSVSRLHQSWPCLIPLIPVRVYGVSHRSEKITPAYEQESPCRVCPHWRAHHNTIAVLQWRTDPEEGNYLNITQFTSAI